MDGWGWSRVVWYKWIVDGCGEQKSCQGEDEGWDFGRWEEDITVG